MKTSANARKALMALAYWADVARNLLEEDNRLELKDAAEQIAEAVAEAMTKLEKENQTPMPKVVVIQHLTLATGGGARALAPGSVYHEAPPPSHR